MSLDPHDQGSTIWVSNHSSYISCFAIWYIWHRCLTILPLLHASTIHCQSPLCCLFVAHLHFTVTSHSFSYTIAHSFITITGIWKFHYKYTNPQSSHITSHHITALFTIPSTLLHVYKSRIRSPSQCPSLDRNARSRSLSLQSPLTRIRRQHMMTRSECSSGPHKLRLSHVRPLSSAPNSSSRATERLALAYFYTYSVFVSL